MDKPVITKNGKTITFSNNIVWIISLAIAIVTLYGIVVSPMVWKTGIENEIDITKERTSRLEKWQEECIQEDKDTQQVLHEIVINQKIIMQTMGIKYETYKDSK